MIEIRWQKERMENIKYGRRREGRWTPIWAKAQDTRANPNSWETHLVRKRWGIGLLRALSPRIMMMMKLLVNKRCVYRHNIVVLNNYANNNPILSKQKINTKEKIHRKIDRQIDKATYINVYMHTCRPTQANIGD